MEGDRDRIEGIGRHRFDAAQQRVGFGQPAGADQDASAQPGQRRLHQPIADAFAQRPQLLAAGQRVRPAQQLRLLDDEQPQVRAQAVDGAERGVRLRGRLQIGHGFGGTATIVFERAEMIVERGHAQAVAGGFQNRAGRAEIAQGLLAAAGAAARSAARGQGRAGIEPGERAVEGRHRGVEALFRRLAIVAVERDEAECGQRAGAHLGRQRHRAIGEQGFQRVPRLGLSPGTLFDLRKLDADLRVAAQRVGRLGENPPCGVELIGEQGRLGALQQLL